MTIEYSSEPFPQPPIDPFFTAPRATFQLSVKVYISEAKKCYVLETPKDTCCCLIKDRDSNDPSTLFIDFKDPIFNMIVAKLKNIWRLRLQPVLQVTKDGDYYVTIVVQSQIRGYFKIDKVIDYRELLDQLSMVV